MSISLSTLTAIQKVGAAAFTADEKLKKEVQNYAERVNTAMLKNPYNLGNDALIEGWKAVARLSQTMIGIEAELKNIHRTASELTQDDQPNVRDTLVLAAPVAKKENDKKAKAKKMDAEVTTVKVKTQAKAKKAVSTKSVKPTKPVAVATPVAPVVDTAKVPAKRRVAKKAAVVPATAPVKAKAAPIKAAKKVVAAAPKAAAKVAVKSQAKSNKSKSAIASVQTTELKGNSAKLMAELQKVLNLADFTDINQSAVAKVAGIPVGSMGATIGRLVKAGRIVSSRNGSLKLTTTPAVAPSVVQAEAQPVAAVPAESAVLA